MVSQFVKFDNFFWEYKYVEPILYQYIAISEHVFIINQKRLLSWICIP